MLRRVAPASLVCLILAAIVSPAGLALSTDLVPCRMIGDKVDPRFSAVWLTDNDVWAADDLNQSLILYDRLTGKERKRIRGLSTGVDFPAAVQTDSSFKLSDGQRGVIWLSMNDTSDRAVVFSKPDVDSLGPAETDLAPAHVLHFKDIKIDGKTIYNETRAYGFFVDERNDEIALGLEKGNFIGSDGQSSLGSVVIVNRGGVDASRMGTGKRWIRGPHTGIANPHGVWIDTSHNEIYVTNYGHLPQRAPHLPSITIYDRTADGDVPPKRIIQGTRTHLGMPIKVLVDNKNNEIIVADDQEGILVFGRLANGNALPTRMISSHSMPSGVFVDEAHDELVVANWHRRSIEFYARMWDGHNLHPHPKRSIEINVHVPVIGIGNPGALAFARDEIIAPNCVSHPGFTAYERTASGAAHPKRHVEGYRTQMSRSIHGLQVWQHPTDPRLDEIFIPKPLGGAILVFNRTDDGDVKPKRVIQGPSTRLDDNEALAVDEREIAVPNRDGSILVFPRLGNGNIAPIRQITYRAGEKDPVTGKWLGPWGEGSRIRLGPAIWFTHTGPAGRQGDEIVVRARYSVRDPATDRTAVQHVIAFFPRNANGPTVPTRMIASKDLTGVHQVTVLGTEVFNAVQGQRADNPPSLGGLFVFDGSQTSTLTSDGRTLSDVSPKRFLRAGDIKGGLSGVKHPRAVAVDPVRREVYLGDSKGNDIRVFRVDWQNEPCVKTIGKPSGSGREHGQ